MKPGDIFPTKMHGLIEIVSIRSSRDVEIKFIETGWKTSVRADSIRRGNVRDRLAKTICGVGYLGQKDLSHLPDYSKLYSRWVGMIRRCYDEDVIRRRPTYAGCKVCNEWHSLENFIDWCISHPDWNKGDWEVDKDILFKGNKTYSPDTCCFVPIEINNLFVKKDANRGDYPIGVVKVTPNRYRAQCNLGDGTLYKSTLVRSVNEAFSEYKRVKESVIRNKANKYENVISERTYLALINYKVEISD